MLTKSLRVSLHVRRKLLVPLPNSAKKKRDFDPREFLATIGEGRKVVAFPKKQTIFTQGDTADAIFYIQEGKVRLTVVSKIGKEATLGHIGRGRLLRRGWPCRTASTHGVCNRDDRLRTHASRQEGNDVCTSPGTYIVRPVYRIFVGTEHPIRSGLG